MNIIIIEDETPSARRLQRMLASLNMETETMLHSVEESIKHVLSHRVLFCTFFEIEIDQLPKLSKTILTPINNLHDFPVSRLTEKYITQS